MPSNTFGILHLTAPEQYKSIYPNAVKVWYDPDSKLTFSKHQTVLNNHDGNYSFFDEPETWIDSVHGDSRVTKQYQGLEEGGNLCWRTPPDDVNSSTEGYITQHPLLLEHQGKSVLIVGAGPSTNGVKWKKVVDAYNIDAVWSMNHFFYNADVLNHPKLSLISLGNEIDFNQPILRNLIDSNDRLAIYQEPCFVKKNYNDFIEKYKDQIGWFHLRYCSKLGVAPRMILLAILSGVKDIYVVGFDGFTWERKDSFRTDNGISANVDTYSKAIWRSQLLIFWEYVAELRQKYDFRVYNLGHGHPKNMSSAIDFIRPSSDILELL